MIKKLQIKFIAIIMSIMTIVMFFVFATINILMYKSGQRQSYNIMREIAMNDGTAPFKKTPKPYPSSKEPPIPQTHFSVKLNNKNEIIEIVSRIDITNSEDITELIQSILKREQGQGKNSGYNFLIVPKSYGKIIVFLDNSMEINMINRLILTSIGIGAASLVVIFLISLYLSSWAIKPVKEAFQTQKQFVADASHELKTPLAVISTNVDVLYSEIGSNKWLEFIKLEVQRMTSLVNNLLYLAKADSSENLYKISEFDLSNAIMNACLPFESVAYENSKNLYFDIIDGVIYEGDEKRIQQVVVILLDNAIKNSNDNGGIKVSLTLQNGRKVISVYNTGEGIDETEIDKLFKRFYRGDSSRTRETGGYGLGLSIAKAIIDAHKGNISVESKKGEWVKFIVTL